MAELSVGLTPHRLEFLDAALKLMEEHEAVVLEEPPHPDFYRMLKGELEVEDFVAESEAGFPEYSKALYEGLRGLFEKGKAVVQLEPYLERVIEIHERLSEGKTPEDILKDPLLGPVYHHEHETFGRLLEFYSSMKAPFEVLVERIKAFAFADAKRILYRDELRAEAIRELLERDGYRKVYVEAGYIHWRLVYLLARSKPAGWHLRVYNLILSALKGRGLCGLWPSPGDGLTSYYLYGRRDPQREDLLAARSIVYIRLIEKNELKPSTDDPFPHLRDELLWRAFVRELDYESCKKLDSRIRLLPTAEARRVAAELERKAYRRALEKVNSLLGDLR